MKGRVLIIAGSDSGGGAGIQADLKTVTALGGYAATAITALTAQNTRGVFDIISVEPAFVRRQIGLVLDDIGADCLKTGMLHSAAVIHAVIDEILLRGNGIPLVADPVMVAKGGAVLLDADATQALIGRLIPRATVLTPNLPEAEALLGRAIPDVEAMKDAAQTLRAMGARAVLVKGGHLAGEMVVDVLSTAEGLKLFKSLRIDTPHTHGTGCTLASAIATGLAQGRDVVTAVTRARLYVLEAIRTAPGLGQGHGPLNHGHTVGQF